MLGFVASTQPCILREVIDRPNLGQKRLLRSKGHHHNLPDKTRTVAGVVAKTINCQANRPYRARMSKIKGMLSKITINSANLALSDKEMRRQNR
ncbi:MAG: hypothetical protein EWV49_00565 [Microcystis aeruginosa Ma_QC_Ch_20071001_S25]|uniref:Uncharacterized protein n=1 Tax=Microcystis aeruginosa Ma_QC_Ch_20071001_S25D TaxID=2486250 RepID=A0A552FWL8_MICAE|nr:MAG: hypothetical protein EWV57_08735 [Microcystis aeruginosa Ma_QC_Ch_20071001_S25D]TRU54923.1 MAG: hypothetical protein EWV49_00565 [Microcystis aeruginosa Ma_QC_Ch_20071001_S25]TRU60054.1 MAG: hypothetical protein EWV90_15810 [Microcystis aeruginosa Ma_QC_Ch_20071001_M135]